MNLLILETKKLFTVALVAQLEADEIIEEYLDDFSFPSDTSRKVSKGCITELYRCCNNNAL
jgi:hypothetical protein